MGKKWNMSGNVTYLRKANRNRKKEAILAFLADGPKLTEEVRRHLFCEYYLVGDLLRELRAEGKIQSARSPSQHSSTQKRWRLTPVPQSIGGDDGS